MVSGLIRLVFGVYCAWWPYRTNRPPLGSSTGITIGGIGQIVAQYIGYKAIKTYQALKVQVKEIEKCNLHGEELDNLKQQPFVITCLV
jgi:peptidoglycan biosynthesis protein MviN/MurJ (putative lipid II flippase)